MSFQTLADALEGHAAADADAIRAFLAASHAADIAQFLKDYEAQIDWRVLDFLDITKQAEVLGYLDRGEQVALARYPDNCIIPIFAQ